MTVMTPLIFDDFDGSNVLTRQRRADWTGGDATAVEASSLLTYTLQSYATHGWPGTSNPPYQHLPVQDYAVPQLDIPLFVANGWTMDSFPGMFECKLTDGPPGSLAGNTGSGMFFYPSGGLYAGGVQILNRGNAVGWFQNGITSYYGGTGFGDPATSPHIYQLYFVPSGWPSSVNFPNPNGAGTFTVPPGMMTLWISDDNGASYTQYPTVSPNKTMPFVPYAIGVGSSIGATGSGGPYSDWAEWDWFRYSVYADIEGPYLDNLSPYNGEVGVDPNNNIVLEIHDDSAGVNAASVVIEVNGDTVWSGDAATNPSVYAVAKTTLGTGFRYTINPAGLLPPGTTTVTVYAEDLAT